MKNTWPLDGPDQPWRKTRTWQEVGEACEIELSTRAEIKAPTGGGTIHGLGERVNLLGGGGGSTGLITCSYCKRKATRMISVRREQGIFAVLRSVL